MKKIFLAITFALVLSPLAYSGIVKTGGGSSSSGASTTLNNLTDTVAINKSLLFGAASTYDIGDATNPPEDLFIEFIKKPNGTEAWDLNNGRINDLSGNSSIYIDSKLLRTGPHGGPTTKLSWASSLAAGPVGFVPSKVTADPCADTTLYPEASIFYNDTSNYMCFCNAANADKKLANEATDCF